MIAAKLAVYGLAGGLAGAGVRAPPWLVTAAWWAAKGGSFQLSSAGTWRTLGGGVAVSIAFALIGVGVGALIRNLVAAVAAALAWIALVEGIAGQLLGSGLARWLPFYASESLDRATPDRVGGPAAAAVGRRAGAARLRRCLRGGRGAHYTQPRCHLGNPPCSATATGRTSANT